MTYRVGWLSPLTPASGIGTFSDAVARDVPAAIDGEPIDVTIFYVGHHNLYRSRHRSMEIGAAEDFHEILTLFDLLVYNIGNNREHHEPIFKLMRLHPGIVICHDFVYQHYMADLSLRHGRSFASLAALLLRYGGDEAATYLRRSRITSRTGRMRYAPWDTELSVDQPASEALMALGSALVVHSQFAETHAAKSFQGPILRLGMPCDQRTAGAPQDLQAWERALATKSWLRLVCFGHVQPTKCIDLVLDALGASPALRKGVRFTIAGFAANETYLRELRSLVEALRLTDVVIFELDVTEKRLVELSQEADVFVNLRRPNTEGSSVSLIEQLETGKPVILLGSGCYAEVPDNACIKLRRDAGAEDIGSALERLLLAPGHLAAIGRAGRAFARSWSCATYAEHLLRFAFQHRDLIAARAQFGAIRAAHEPALPPADAWVRNLAAARATFRYLETNHLALDPALILGKSIAELADHVASVIFGIFDDARLPRALARFLARLDRRALYWACTHLMIIADAVFGEDEGARDRLRYLEPRFDPEFWAVVETFPPRQHLIAATLILARRLPNAQELASVGLDASDGFPQNLRIRDLIAEMAPQAGAAFARLTRWLDESCHPARAQDLPALIDGYETDIGSTSFRESADLSGFYAMEPDHAWTRGHHGFLGLHLPPGPVRVDLLVHPIEASSETPCSIRLAADEIAAAAEVTDCEPRWMSIDLPPGAGQMWLSVSSSIAATPRDSQDARVLGLCVRRVRIRCLDAMTDASVRLLRDAAARGRTEAPRPNPARARLIQG